jgi:hypothetical protein
MYQISPHLHIYIYIYRERERESDYGALQSTEAHNY